MVSQKAKWISFFRAAIVEMFTVSLFLYLVLFFIENFQSGFVSNFFSLTTPFYVLLGSGIISVLISQTKELPPAPLKESHKKRNMFFSVGFGIVCSCIIFIKIQSLGALAFIISPIAFFLVIAISMLLWSENPETEK